MQLNTVMGLAPRLSKPPFVLFQNHEPTVINSKLRIQPKALSWICCGFVAQFVEQQIYRLQQWIFSIRVLIRTLANYS